MTNKRYKIWIGRIIEPPNIFAVKKKEKCVPLPSARLSGSGLGWTGQTKTESHLFVDGEGGRGKEEAEGKKRQLVVTCE